MSRPSQFDWDSLGFGKLLKICSADRYSFKLGSKLVQPKKMSRNAEYLDSTTAVAYSAEDIEVVLGCSG